MDSNKYLKHYLKSKNKPIYGIDEVDSINKLLDRMSYHITEFCGDINKRYNPQFEGKLFIPPNFTKEISEPKEFIFSSLYGPDMYPKREQREWGMLRPNIRVFVETADMNKYKWFKSIGIKEYKNYCYLLLKDETPDDFYPPKEACYIFSVKVDNE